MGESTTGGPAMVAPRALLVIHNPTAGRRRRRRLAAALQALEAGGCRIDLRATTGPGDAEGLARDAAASGCDRLVVAGGDGTINEAITGLVAGGTRLPLALIPLGTANVLAAEIGLPRDPRTLARTILEGRPRRIALGRIRPADGPPRVFAMMAGVGFDAHAVAGLDPGLKRRFGKAAYYGEILRQLFAFPFPGYRGRVETPDGGTQGFEAASLVVAKGHYYAGAYVFAPEARLHEPLLHLCLFTRSGRLAALRYGLALQLGLLPRLKDFRIVPATRVALDGPAGDPVQADGDLIARLPAVFEVVPEALDLVMPAETS
ncbi:MAG TPA: diacylglycerol kinase family protein [Kiloniellales bacterium]|nr:diacylglycerol kinase family protein [Kiloniellales bacterium]